MISKNDVENCLKSVGVLYDKGLCVNLKEINSMQFVSAFVELEDTFCIRIPDEFLKLESLSSLDNIYNIIIGIGNKSEWLIIM